MVTTDSIKFKAKSWIDVFGGRASKALGSVITAVGRVDEISIMVAAVVVAVADVAAVAAAAALTATNGPHSNRQHRQQHNSPVAVLILIDKTISSRAVR